jgi:histidyl-tRNA synthetase
MGTINAPRGFEDTLPAQSWKWQFVERTARKTAELYHYAEIRVPVLEYTGLFHRGVGETTDLIRKETFTFEDRGGESLTLRPEGTASVVRAAIEHRLLAQEGSRLKVYYIGPNFRYERPQRGRLRQHHQFGVEAFGIAEPEQDVECIALQMDFYRRCGLREVRLQVNSLGDAESKARYRGLLVEFLQPRRASLSADSQRRLAENPLRILDSKDPGDQEACRGAPPAVDALSERSRRHFERVQHLLSEAQVPFEVNPNLVRGFDYYTQTLWEVTTAGLGSQNAIGGGGRYDQLVEQLGGRATPGVGFGIGIERMLLAMEAQDVNLEPDGRPLIWLVAQGEAARSHCFGLMSELRRAGLVADMDLSGRSVKAQFKLADRDGAAFCLIVGEDELREGRITVKSLSSGQQTSLERGELMARLQEMVSAAQCKT